MSAGRTRSVQQRSAQSAKKLACMQCGKTGEWVDEGGGEFACMVHGLKTGVLPTSI
jgi:hypothetical protein